MVAFKVILILALAVTAAVLAAEELEKRPTRTIARFLGLEKPAQPQPQPQQTQQQQQQIQQQIQHQQSQQQQHIVNPPLVYNVKYYDRAGEHPEIQVEPVVQSQQQQQSHYFQPYANQQDSKIVPSTRIFLNLYTGQQTPVYYDSRGQLYVPCPAYDYQAQTAANPVKAAQVQKSSAAQQQQQQPQVQVQGQVQHPAAEFVYYTGYPFPPQPQQQVQQQPQPQSAQQPQHQQAQKQATQQQQIRPVAGGQPQPFVAPVPVPIPVVPEVLYYTTPQQQQQAINQAAKYGASYPQAPAVVAYNPYEVPYAYVPAPYGFPGVVNPAAHGHGHVVYQGGQGGYVNPFVYIKPAQVTVAPGPGQPVVTHAHVHVQQPQPSQSQQQSAAVVADQVVVEKKNVSEKID